MQHKFPALAGMLMLALALWAGCKEPTALGAQLLGNEAGDYVFTDTLSLRCTIQREDSSLTSDRNSTAEYFLCGELRDPIFGQSSSQIYAQMLGETFNPNFDTNKQAFDSIVLYLRYATPRFYGDTLQPHTLQVLRLADGSSIKPSQDYYSTASFVATEEIGRLDNFMPKPSKQDTLFEGIKGAYLRVVLSPSFGAELFTLDSAFYALDTVFLNKFRGLKIVCTTGGGIPGSMLAFDLNATTLSRMRLFYHDIVDTTRRDFDYFFEGANKFTHFDHQHSGSDAGNLIGQLATDRLYVQGMQGIRVKIELPTANLLDNIAINRAQLVLTVAEEENPMLLGLASQLYLAQLREDLTFDFTSDVYHSFGNNLNGGFFGFGGMPKKVIENGTTVTQYRLALSELLQHMTDDNQSTDTKNRTVYLSVFPRSRTANRVVLYGPTSTEYPAKVEVTYTKVR